METCQYTPVASDIKEAELPKEDSNDSWKPFLRQYTPVASDIKEAELPKEDSNDSWKPFLRQLLILSGVMTTYFCYGLCWGAPTTIIPQLRKSANSTEAVSAEMAAWISSVTGYASIPWIVILPIMFFHIGRKNTFAFVSLCVIGVFVGLIFSATPTHLLFIEVLLGIPHSATLCITLVTAVEYTSPKYRSSFLNFKSPSFYWGVWASNAIGTYFPWKYFAYLGFMISLYTLTVFAWSESPFWLATKGRYEESRTTHRWLKGTDEMAQRELESIIKSQIEIRRHKQVNKDEKMLRTLWNIFKTKEFYKPVLLICILMTAYSFSGKQAYHIYAIDILKDIIGNETTAYNGMLILDGVSVVIMYVGCYIASYVKRRTLFFGFGALSVMFMLALSLHCYLIKLSLIEGNAYVTISLLAGFSIAICIGPHLMTSSLYAEMMPSNYKSESAVIIGLSFAITQSTVLKISPSIFRNWGMHGAFLFYGISLAVSLMALYKHLPETKDKTFLEIAEFLKGNTNVLK